MVKVKLPHNVFKSAVEATSTGVLVTDYRRKDNPIVYANPFFEKLTGYPLHEIVGKNCRFLQGPASDEKTVARIRGAIDAQTSFCGDLLNYRKDGSPFWNHLTISPVKDSLGKTEYFVGIQQDITAEKNAVLARDSMISQLRTINEGLDLFAATTSHELKTPLRVLIGFASLLERRFADTLGDEGSQLLEKVLVNARHLDRCIEDLRQLSALGARALTTEPISVSRLLDETIQYLGLNTQDQHYVYYKSNLPKVDVDPPLLVQVFRNLIDNAVKHAQAKTNGVFIEATKPSADQVKVLVRDRGPGIPQNIETKIFDPFVTSSQSTESGTGLGLAIVKRIIELHNGTICCRSSPDGTTFVIKLPAGSKAL